jgi:hypothetical protein
VDSSTIHTLHKENAGGMALLEKLGVFAKDEQFSFL